MKGDYIIKNGICDCQYKGSCHLDRQAIIMEYRKADETNEVCPYYKSLKLRYGGKQ